MRNFANWKMSSYGLSPNIGPEGVPVALMFDYHNFSALCTPSEGIWFWQFVESNIKHDFESKIEVTWWWQLRRPSPQKMFPMNILPDIEVKVWENFRTMNRKRVFVVWKTSLLIRYYSISFSTGSVGETFGVNNIHTFHSIAVIAIVLFMQSFWNQNLQSSELLMADHTHPVKWRKNFEQLCTSC